MQRLYLWSSFGIPFLYFGLQAAFAPFYPGGLQLLADHGL